MNSTKKFFRVIAFVLFAVIALQLPTFALPADYGHANETEQSDVSSDGSDPFGDGARIIGEDESLRTEDTKHFILSNGTRIAAQYEVPVHYKDNGEWKDIDNTLTLQNSVDADDIKGFVNTSSGVRFKFASNSKSAKLFRMKFDEYEVSWGLAGTNFNNVSPVVAGKPSFEDLDENERATALENLSSVVRYADIFDGVDIEYVVRGNDVKENIVIKEKQDSYSYKFEIKTKKLTASLEEDGSVSLKNNSGETVLVIPSPFMYDANGDPSQEVSFDLVKKNGNGKYELTVTADKTWVDNAAFPVTVDPYLKTESNRSSFDTSWYTESKPNAHTETYSFVAGKKDGTRNRGYLKVLTLPTLSSSDVITSATLVMCQGGSIFPTNTESKGVFVYEAPTFSGTYPTWRQLEGKSLGDALDYNKRTIANDTYISFNITRAVKKWYKDPTLNNGLIFIGSNENSSSDAFIRYWSEDNGGVAYRPSLVVSYLNCKGLENYQSYHTASAASAGTGYVNDFSGALTFVHSDFAGSGSRMPVSVSHIYNSAIIGEDRYYAQFYTDEMQSGKGWKLNVQEKIRNITNAPEDQIDNSDATYVFTDEDGTEHYFKLKSGESATGNPRSYVCETDPDLTLTRKKTNNVTTFTMVNDKTHYSKIFDGDGYITAQKDNNGNTVAYTYGSYNHTESGSTVVYKYLTKVTDGAGREYTFGYDSKHRVTSITDPAGKKITYSYNANGELTTITYPWNKTSTFEYENGLLIKATDKERNYSVKYEYGTGADARKVVKVTEYGGETAGITLGITYNDNATTVFRTAGSDDVYGTADDLLTTYGFDYLGRCIVAYTTDLDKNNIYGVSSSTFQNSNKVSTGNKITESASIGVYTPNLIADPSFEKSSRGGSEVNATVTVDDTEHYFGAKSRKIVVSEANAETSGFYLTSITNKPGKHTFSVYVKLSDITKDTSAEESGLAIKIKDADDVITEKVFRFESDNIGEWQRIELPFNINRFGLVFITLGLKNASGTLYADMAQLEKGDCATYPNAVINGSFGSELSGWTTSGAKVTSAATLPGDYTGDPLPSVFGSGLRIDGDFITNSYAEQTIVVNDNISDTFILSGWGKATSAQTLTTEQENTASSDNHNIVNKTGTRFMLKATVKYEDKKTSTGATRTNRTYTVEIPFNDQYTGWQFVSKPIIVKTDNGYEVTKINTITIAAVYANNLNTAYFDNIALVRDVAYSYTYDANGNVTSTQALKEQLDTLEYSSSNDLTKQNNASGFNYEYTYDSNHNMLTATSEGKVKTTLVYDDKGNPTSTVISASPESNDNSKIYSSATYTSDKNYTASLTDSRGNTVRYDVNLKTGITNSVTDANGGKTVYTYDDRDRLVKVNSAKEDGSSVRLREEEVSYTYENGRLVTISSPWQWSSKGGGTKEYSFVYDEFGNVLSTKFGTKTLMTNTYAPNNGKLTSSTYGNGASINYYYDNLDRIVSLRYNNNEQTAFNYTYNRFGSVSSITDTASGIAKIYDYDTVDRLISARTENGTNDAFRTHYTYDGLSRLDTLKYVYSTAAGTQYTHEYSATYGTDSRVESFALDGIFSITPTFDGLGRQSSRVLKNGSGAQVEKEDYAFLAGAGGNNATTTLIGSATYYGAGTTGTQYSYEYDANNNLTAIKKNGTTLHTYTYDSLGQLTSWYNAATNETTVYEYFKGGNIASITKGDEVREFLYGINDQLTYYNEKFLTYDNVGNPLNYRDLIRLTWKNGRQMATFKLGETLASYDYDENGIRTKKTVNGITTTFQLDGSKIVSENRNGTVQSYFYDENGSVLGITYGGENYYFRKNFRNDVLAILNASGEVVVEYSYDPWGNILAVTGSLASTLGSDNPFRYRGYYYDTESCFYYLNSRYYDAKVCRFVNADTILPDEGGDIRSYNLYLYCVNNPVNFFDTTGNWPEWLEKAAKVVATVVAATTVVVATAVAVAGTGGAALVVAGIACGAACSGFVGGVANEKKGESFINGWIGGAANGAIQSSLSFAMGAIGTTIGGGVGSGIGTFITEKLNNMGKPEKQKKSTKEILKDSAKAAIIGTVFSSITAGLNHCISTAIGNRAYDLMPELTPAFGEVLKYFFGVVDDSITYCIN